MAARREHGAPSALTVLEVAEGLRWTDPALGASLAEHARRLAGDDPTLRAAADRAIIRSLAESDRHEDVVARGVPLLAEARERGDRDDGAAVLVELADAATGLGDPGLARRLLDRLGPTAELPARVGAAACAARAEACAADGDVAGADAAGDAVSPMLFRVPQPESGVVRARIQLARGVARRRAGDLDGALAALDAAACERAGDDGGRPSLTAAAELTELLVETGRYDDARQRAHDLLLDGSADALSAAAVGRARLALALVPGSGARSASAVAEDLEATGRSADAARAWELVATLAEAEGDLGGALTALRRGHALGAGARDVADRALRTLAAVAEGSDPLAPGVASTDPGRSTGPRRRARRDGPTAEPAPVPPLPNPGTQDTDGLLDSTDGAAPQSWTAPAVTPASPVVVEAPAVPPDGAARADAVPPTGAAEAPGPPTEAPETARATRDELAELLASLTRSVDSSRASASALGLEAAPPASSDAAATTNGRDRGPDPLGSSRHSAPTAPPEPAAQPTVEPTATRPTFDAFSTAPNHRFTDVPDPEPTPVGPLPDHRFAPVGEAGEPLPAEAGTSSSPRSVSDLVDPLSDPLEGPGAGAAPEGAPSPPAEKHREDDVVAAAPVPQDEGRPTEGDGRADTAVVPSDATGARADRSRRQVSGPEVVDDGSTGRDEARTPVVGVGSAGPADPGSGTTRSPERDTDATRDADRRTAGDAARRGVGHEEPGRELRDGTRPVDRTNGHRAHGAVAPGRGADEASGSAGLPRGDGATSARPAPGRAPRAGDEYDDELALTLATVLAEYHLPDVAMPPRRDRGRPAPPADPPVGNTPAGDVPVPAARRHTSGSLPLPADQRWAPRADGPAARPTRTPGAEGRRPSGEAARGRPAESGARLADLLAEAMDAFRHVGPEAQDGARGPGVGSRRA